MATTQTAKNIDFLRGGSGPDTLKAWLVVVNVNGTYDSAAKPSFDLLTLMQDQHYGVTAVDIKAVSLFRDYRSGSTRYTAPNAQIALSSTGNKTVTFRLDSGATDGATGTQIADTTAVDGDLVFLVVGSLTGAP